MNASKHTDISIDGEIPVKLVDDVAAPELVRTGEESPAVTIAGVEVVPPDMPPIVATPVPSELFTATGATIQTTDVSGDVRDWTLVEAIRGVVESVQVAIEEIVTAVKSSLVSQVAECVAPVAECEACITGDISRQLDRVESTFGKCHQKVVKPIRSILCDAGACLSYCGVVYPSHEQVSYGLTTGDYLGSVGLCQEMFGSTAEPKTVEPQECPAPAVSCPAPVVNVTVQAPGAAPDIRPINVGLSLNTFLSGVRDGTIDGATIVNNVSPANFELLQQFLPLVLPNLVLPVPEKAVPEKEEIEEKLEEEPKIQVPFEEITQPKAGGGAGPDKFIPPDWNNIAACTALDVAGMTGGFPKVGPDSYFGFFPAGEEKVAPNWFVEAWKDTPRILRPVEWTSWWVGRAVDWMFANFSDLLGGMFRCRNATALPQLLMRTVLGFLEHWTGGAITPVMKGYDQWIAWACPQELPTSPDVDELFLKGMIDRDLWECWQRANNQLPAPAWIRLQGKRTKIDFRAALMLNRWGKIDDADYIKACQQNGIIDNNDRLLLEKSLENVPSVSDLIRMMVRDVEDRNIVRDQHLDHDFEKKWTGKLADFGNAQGITPEIAQYHWRAHWDYPSATQAFEMLHRLRPGSRYVQEIKNRLLARNIPADLADVSVTQEHVEELLAINDLAPKWRHRLIATSYRPLTRIDAQRAYEIGALGPDEKTQREVLSGIFQDEGYTESDANILVEFTDRKVKRAERRRPLPRQLNAWITRYKKWLVTDVELQFQIAKYIDDPAKRQNVFDEAQIERDWILVANKVDCIRRSYSQGLLDDVEARTALVKEGIGIPEASALVESYWCKKKAANRQVTAAKLCEWREKRLINAGEHLTRLVNLGYRMDDAERIVRECEIDISERQFKAAKKLLADRERIAKAQEAAALRQAKAEAKAAKDAAKAEPQRGKKT